MNSVQTIPSKTHSQFQSMRLISACFAALLIAPLWLGLATAQTSYHFDFGAAGTEPGYVAVSNTTSYSAAQGYGWVTTTGLNLRDRAVAGNLRRDFIFTNTVTGVTFRASGLTPSGKYLIKVLCGDASYGDHIITVSIPGAGTLPTISPKTGQYLQLSASVNADSSGILNITFGSPTPNWVVNALTIEPTSTDITPFIESSPLSEWDPVVYATNPTTALLSTFNGNGAVNFTSTGRTRADYLALITSEIDFWKTKQNTSGAIIDPYRNVETQYSTPAFANAAAALVVYANRSDLLEPAALAMDWATLRLHNRLAADSHEDFYPGMLAHALKLLKPLVASTRAATWESNLNYDPYAIYRQGIGTMNWNIVSSSGEALLQLAGIRSTSNTYVTESWAAQGRNFKSSYGLYTEGPMPYDHFPRIWLEDAIAQGYAGPFSTDVKTALDRAAITSLFMQSPWGELPAGGRSAHHQWNEAEQCVTYEIYAAKAEAAGNPLMAGAYKRAAHLALSSMYRWVRPTGEMQVLKNWVNPSSRHGYESYSYHSQYNLLPMAMLSMAYEYAATSEDVAESASPADTGGFVFQVPVFDKVFANAGGTYVELDTIADHHYDATGLIRVHKIGIAPQLGPSDSLLTAASYTSPNPSTFNTGVGVSWKDASGNWRTLGEMGSTEITSVTVTPLLQSSARVVFDVTYAGTLPNVTSITEHYIITTDGVQLTTQLNGYSGALRYLWPVLSNDGKTTSTINVSGNTVSTSQGGTPQTFTASGAQSVSVGSTDYSNHNGWARLAIAEYPSGGTISMLISQTTPSVNTAYWKGQVDAKWNTLASSISNWTADAAGTIKTAELPSATTDVVFAATGASNQAATILGANFSARSLTLNTSLPVGIGGTHSLTLGAGGITVGNNAGAATINTTGQLVLAADQTWTNASSNNLTINSVIAGGAFGLTKQGMGTLVLSSANTYSGATSINAGTLIVNGSLGNTAVSIANTATLAGIGSIAGATTINGTHSPGNSAGTQNFGSTLYYGATSHLKWELVANSTSAGSYDKITATGTATITSGAAFDVVLNASGSSVALNDAFWSQAHTWTFLTGSNIYGNFTIGTVSNDGGGRAISNYGTFSLQSNASSATLVFTPYTPSELWRLAHFGFITNTGNAADAADPDHDGLNNLLEYALGADPNISNSANAPQVSTSTGKLRILFNRNTAASDITLLVMASNTLANDWTEIARSTNGAAFTLTAAAASVSESGTGTIKNVETTDIYLVIDPAHPKRFMRVEVMR